MLLLCVCVCGGGLFNSIYKVEVGVDTFKMLNVDQKN